MIIVPKGQLIYQLHLFVVIMLILSSCVPIQKEIQHSSPIFIPSTSTPTPTPQHSPTAMPPYIQSIPHKALNIYLEFDYPSNWVLEKDTQYKDELIISLLDPRFRTLPTRSPTESHGIPSDFGSVAIWVIPVEPDQNIDTLIESFKQGSSGSSWIKPLNDYKITIDGYDASVFEDQIDFPDLYTSLMFERNIFFAVKDQIYQITFTVAEKERGGEFEKGYEYFFNSLNIVP